MLKSTSICLLCGDKTKYDDKLLGKKPSKYGYHAYCPNCCASFSNARNPEKRVIVWDNIEKNLYNSYEDKINRLKQIINHSMNEGNRVKKEPSMRSENSEDALTWSIFSALEEHDLLNDVFCYFTNTNVPVTDTCIYYWGYNDKYPKDKMIKEYISVLNKAGEPEWRGGYSEPDILLFSPLHGIVNIEVKYKSPNDDKLRDKGNLSRIKRAQQMIDIGKKYVQKQSAVDWTWYELLRMWVPGCVVAERMNLKSFTLINLLPQTMLKKEKDRVTTDMQGCIKQSNAFKFKQVVWEDFMEYVFNLQCISVPAFQAYYQMKFGK